MTRDQWHAVGGASLQLAERYFLLLLVALEMLRRRTVR
jgi:hypothetical protein